MTDSGDLLPAGAGNLARLGLTVCDLLHLRHRRNFSGTISMRTLSRRCLLLAALIAPWAAHAQNWPAGNIKIVVPYPPGGSTDMIARLIQPHMQQRLGTTVIIENRAGGGGSIGTA